MKLRNTLLLCILGVVLLAACGFRTRTTSIRGYVHSGDLKVAGGEVRLSTLKGGLEATSIIGSDGRFRVELEHPSGSTLVLKILQPGFEHDPIEFNSAAAPAGEMDINLRRIFKPGSTESSNSNANSNARSNK